MTITRGLPVVHYQPFLCGMPQAISGCLQAPVIMLRKWLLMLFHNLIFQCIMLMTQSSYPHKQQCWFHSISCPLLWLPWQQESSALITAGTSSGRRGDRRSCSVPQRGRPHPYQFSAHIHMPTVDTASLLPLIPFLCPFLYFKPIIALVLHNVHPPGCWTPE